MSVAETAFSSSANDNLGPKVRYNLVMRDAVQSLMATAVSAQQVLGAHQNIHKIGGSTIQTSGGTFFDMFSKNGRDEWAENDQLLAHFREHNVRQTMLVRGDFLLGYKPVAFDVIKAFVKEFAMMGMNDFQNFNGVNDVRLTEGVAEAVRQVREETGLDIQARAGIMITDVPNNTLDNLLRAAETMIKQGHVGHYFKSASGCVKPEFFAQVVETFIREFGPEVMDAHIHGTYGKSSIAYMEGIDAAISNGHSLGVDVQPPGMANSTAHEDVFTMDAHIKSHPKAAIRSAAPVFDKKAARADYEAQMALRFLYRDQETRYNLPLHERMEKAYVPGGASSTLRGYDGLEGTISGGLSKKHGRQVSWDDCQIDIYENQYEVWKKLGFIEPVTPNAANTTKQAAFSTMYGMMHDDGFDRVLVDETVDLLVGDLGAVPDGVDPEWQRRALEMRGLTKVREYVKAQDRPDELPDAVEYLKTQGIENPTVRQAISSLMLQKGPAPVVACAFGKNEPAPAPELPGYACGVVYKSASGKVHKGASDIFDALGGAAYLHGLAVKAAHMKKMDDGVVQYPSFALDKMVNDRNAIADELTDFVKSIPKVLTKAGFNGYAPDNQNLFKKNWLDQRVNEVLTDIFDNRAEGAMAYIKGIVAQRNAGPTPSVEQDLIFGIMD